jgi:RNA polymerase sigma-70 factor (ECF subfamily)
MIDDAPLSMPAAAADDAFAALYATSFSRLARELGRIVGADAEDVAQEALLVAQRRWSEVAMLDRPEAWVRRVALRLAARRGQRDRSRVALEPAVAPPRPAAEPDLDLVAAILELPDRHAAAVQLHHLEDRPIAEVAERLGCSEAAAKVLLFRARRLLGEHLAGMTGRWISTHTWTLDALARHLAREGWAAQREAVIDSDWLGRAGRFELTVSDGAYVLRRDDGHRFDHGWSRVTGSSFELAPELLPGRSRYRARVDGRRLTMQFVDSTLPAHLGIPEPVWSGMYYDIAEFVRADPAPPL